MNLQFDVNLAEHYKSKSQRARVMSESWLHENMFCPCCKNPRLEKFSNNKPVADVYCPKCGEIFELKSKEGVLGPKIVDGEYFTMIERIQSNTNPHLFVLQYSPEFSVQNFYLVPKFFFVPAIIEKRKPLSQTARRAGWTGCNIFYDAIPRQGKIPVVSNGLPRGAEDVFADYLHAAQLTTDNVAARGWMFDVLNCLNRIAANEFCLDEMYRFESDLQALHKDNHNIRPKIRQQLQVLRDKGFIEFLSSGHYRKIQRP